MDCRIPQNRMHWLQTSAAEWMASENMLDEPEYSHATSLNTKFAVFLDEKEAIIRMFAKFYCVA